MSCSKCTKKFGLFSREAACPGCGYSVCSACLKHSVLLPGKPKPVKVCNSCHEQQHGLSPARPPPDALLKRLEGPRPGGGQAGPGTEDDRLAARLAALGRDRAAPPSAMEVQARLDKLKGVRAAAPAPLRPPDTRGAVEQQRDLLAGLQAEVELERRLPVLSPDQEIAARLARLRGEQPAPVTNTNTIDHASFLHLDQDSSSDLASMEVDEVAKLLRSVDKRVEEEAKVALTELEKDKKIQEQLARLRVRPDKKVVGVAKSESESEEDEVGRVVSQLTEEARLDDGAVTGLDSGPEPSELPWCVVCNEDAVVRCRDCGGDLYCAACFSEFHQDREDRGHRTVRFRK